MNIADKLSNRLQETSTGCWEYIGSLNHDGYGVITLNYKQHRIHRLVWEIEKGPIPAGVMVLHSCDNRCCGNPSHLFLGSGQDNVDDMITKGRDSFGDNFGENNGQAKLTADDVLEIKQLLELDLTHQQIADLFNVSRRAISHIKNGNSWSWL